MAVQVGKKAPQFKLKNAKGNVLSSKDFLGKGLIVYFYPKDLTPGCTQEACDFRDFNTALKKKGYAVVGISKDSEELHQKFIDTHDLNFTLLSDPKGEVCEKFGVWKEKSLYGRKSMGIVRSTFIIDAEGKIEEIFENVRAKGHVEKLLDYLGTRSKA